MVGGRASIDCASASGMIIAEEVAITRDIADNNKSRLSTCNYKIVCTNVLLKLFDILNSTVPLAILGFLSLY